MIAKRALQEDLKNDPIKFRLTDEERVRWDQAISRIQGRNRYITLTDIIKELTSVNDPVTVTDEDRKVIRHGISSLTSKQR